MIQQTSDGKLLVCVDAHSHFHSCFDTVQYLNAACHNVDRAVAFEDPLAKWIGMLLLADMAQQNSVADLQRASRRTGAFVLLETAEEGSWLVQQKSEIKLVLIAGQQLVSREGIEVLSLATAIRLPERLPLEEYPQRIREAKGLCVLPWGFGKWWSRRGRCVRQMLDRFAQGPQIFLGDNGLRPALVPAPRMFRHAEIDWPILPGSDPLPFASHAQRIASFGLALETTPDLAQPGVWIRETLQRPTASWRTYGRTTTIPRFLSDQLSLQLRKVAAV